LLVAFLLSVFVVLAVATLLMFNRIRLTFLLCGIALSAASIVTDDPLLGLLGFFVVTATVVATIRAIFQRKQP
jgi:hypothetical protein